MPKHSARFVCPPTRIALYLALAGLPALASAVALGEMKLTSHLGEVFAASVRINALPGEVIARECLSASLRDGGDDGTPRRVLLDFQSDKQGGLLRLQGLDSLFEPVATLSLRVQCADGAQMRREYTLLLDPPSELAPAAPPPTNALPLAVRSNPPAAPLAQTSPSAPVRTASLASLNGEWLTRAGETYRSIARQIFPDQREQQDALIAELRRLNAHLPPRGKKPLAEGIRLRLPKDIQAPKAAQPSKPRQEQLVAATPLRQDKLSLSEVQDSEASPPPPEELAAYQQREQTLQNQLSQQTAQLEDAQTRIAKLEAQGRQMLAALNQRNADIAAAEQQAQRQQWLGVGGLIALVLAVAAALAALLLRGRKRAPQPSTPAPLTDNQAAPSTELPDFSPAIQRPASAAPAQPHFADESTTRRYNDDLQDSDMDVVMLSHVASEAAVLAAHGHYDKAVALLQDELELHPTHLVNWMQLLELHYTHQDAERFVPLARAFREQFASTAMWEKVARLGAQLLPDEPLFGMNAKAEEDAAEELTRMLDGLSASAPGEAMPSATEPAAAASAAIELEPLVFELGTPAQDADTPPLALDLIEVPPVEQVSALPAGLKVPESGRGKLEEASQLIADGESEAGAAILEHLMLKGSQEERMAAAELLVRLTAPRQG